MGQVDGQTDRLQHHFVPPRTIASSTVVAIEPRGADCVMHERPQTLWERPATTIFLPE